MKSIVRELQKMALNSDSVIELLRKAKVVAVKLDLIDILDWIENELNGYKDVNSLPEYRKISGNAKAWEGNRGWIPVIFNDPKKQSIFCSVNIVQSVGELQNLAKSNADELMTEFSPKRRKSTADSTGVNTRYALFISLSSVVNIIEAVQNKILDWSLNLEKSGIIGEGLTFTDDEKKKALNMEYISLGRIEELQNIQNKNYDLMKLIRLCEELNQNYQMGCYFSCAMLGRTIIDHVPPIFNQKTFNEVVNNYNGSKSFKKSMSSLQTSLRNISDAHLHEQIRNKEILPNGNQVDFSSDLDVLLGEICRILK